ncbi:MAG: DNA-binding NarL/FixJ family response regulator [Crocinitomicaceae bacterium]|jgi:DNA-binding NarL/FixJ family response regulator
MSKKINVAIVEDHDMVRQGMVMMLKEDKYIRVVFEAENGAVALEKLKEKEVDIILLDLELPVIDGRRILKILKERKKDVSVIVISAHHQKIEIIDAIASGAKGFLPKHCDFDKVIDAIYAVHEKGFYFDDIVSQALVFDVIKKQDGAQGFLAPLSTREIEVIQLVCRGKTNKDIADELFLSKRTIDSHRAKISIKTNTSSIAELVLYAIRHEIHKLN